MTEENIKKGDRYLIRLKLKKDDKYLIQLKLKKNYFMFNTWDYIESYNNKNKALKVFDDLYDESVHKIELVDIITNSIIKSIE